MSVELSFETFVRAHASELLRAAVMLTGNRDRGEELLQDTLAHLYPRWEKVVAADVPMAYVRRVLVNRLISEQRAPWRRSIPVWDVPERSDAHDLGETVSTQGTVWQLLGELPERQRAAVVLRYFYDLPDSQIADILGCRNATVRSLLSRAIGVMRRELAFSGADDKAGS